ncbi:FecR family protein [Pseudomonas fontis]|uniref:FecR domain-containing protein n=1 Tax=Pseudomonas fontis TaxID=2942633 RepID=A0ABT5NWQ0_9PSED|nr:FecR domain-containing protein [Pseudomonas fontis]MDD0975749.1 FecR domain-containing protein [Pseudomonas fontis]MDD0992612.1 FecR domain-containing protein [Pseudomonas fontis]
MSTDSSPDAFERLFTDHPGWLQRRQLVKLLTLFAGVGAAAWGLEQATPWQRVVADHATEVGERRRLTLADGSSLDLNTDSAVRLYDERGAQTIELLRGEISVHLTGHAPSGLRTMLRVRTDAGLLEAMAAQFSARLDADGIRLSVLRGTVQMFPQVVPDEATAQAGECWMLQPLRVWLLEGVAAQVDATAWRDGVLVARDMPLERVLAELGRYRHGRLSCDPQLAQLPISGHFQLEDINATLGSLAHAHGLKLHSVLGLWTRLSAA